MEDGEKVRFRNRVIDSVVFMILLTGVSAVTLVLFYRQTMGNPGSYHSDMKAYILEMQGLESGYQFPYPVFFKLGALIHIFAPPELSVAIATMLLNSLGIIVTKLAFNHLTLQALEDGFRLCQRGRKSGKGNHGQAFWHDKSAAGKRFEGNCGESCAGSLGVSSSSGIVRKADLSWLAGVVISLVVVCLFFVSMLYPPSGIYLPGIRFKYLGVFTANPFHNATYMAARPFAILAFLWYVKLLAVYEQGVRNVTDYVLFAVFLLLATILSISTAQSTPIAEHYRLKTAIVTWGGN